MNVCIHAYINAGQYNCATCQCTNALRCCPFVRIYICVCVYIKCIQWNSIKHLPYTQSRSSDHHRLFFMPLRRTYICVTDKREKTQSHLICFYNILYFFSKNNTEVTSRDYLVETEKKKRDRRSKQNALFVTYMLII
jgi:hypothetical protein